MTDQVQTAPENKVFKVAKRVVIGAVLFCVVAFVGLVLLVETGVLPVC